MTQPPPGNWPHQQPQHPVPHYQAPPQHAQPQYQQPQYPQLQHQQPQYQQPQYQQPQYPQAGFGYAQPAYLVPPAPAPQPVQPVWQQPVKRSNTPKILAIVGICVLGIVGLVVLGLVAISLGVGIVPAFFMALVPLAIVSSVLIWIDRWEPEPRLAIAFAFLWGAAASVAFALIVGLATSIATAASGAQPNTFVDAAIQAPLAEEFGKGLGLLLIFLVARKYFDGPIDGIVYAAWIAVGFAFTENILYFGAAIVESGVEGAGEIFVVRGLLSPFAHVLFTSVTGMMLGIGARKFGVFGAIGFWFLGLVGAMFGHAFWNGALFFVADFYVYYVIIQVPVFIVAVVLVLLLRRRDVKIIAHRLHEYANSGWFSAEEVGMISTSAGRRQARVWAKGIGKGSAMRQFILTSTRLAFARERLAVGRDSIGNRKNEAELLVDVTESRRLLLAPVAQAGYPRAY